MADEKYTLVYTGEEVDERLGRQDNIQLSTVPAEREKDQNNNETNQATIPGTLDGAIVCDVDNYYLHKAHVIAKTWTPIRDDQEDEWTSTAEHEVLGIKNENGDFLIPYANGGQMGTSGNPLGAILCMASFLNQGMVYGRNNSVFATGESTYQSMVCSDFVCAGLRGITYNNSKASGCGENFESQYKSRTCQQIHSLLSPNDKDALITRELAYVFAANNALFELDYRRLSNLNIGDVLFFATASTSAAADGVAHTYMEIGHCALVVDVDYDNGLVCVLESGQATQTALFNYSFTYEGKTSSGPAFDAYRIFNEPGSSTIIPTRKIYVGKPAWPYINPTLVSSTTLTGSITPTSNYSSAWFTLYKSEANFKKGDLIIAKLTSNLNDLNPDGKAVADGGYSYVLRIDGARTVDGVTTSKPLWRTFTRGVKDHIPNDRVMIFPVDDEEAYTRIRVMLRSTHPNVAITGTCTFDVYRL